MINWLVILVQLIGNRSNLPLSHYFYCLKCNAFSEENSDYKRLQMPKIFLEPYKIGLELKQNVPVLNGAV